MPGTCQHLGVRNWRCAHWGSAIRRTDLRRNFRWVTPPCDLEPVENPARWALRASGCRSVVNNARQTVTPTTATIAGRCWRILASRISAPASNSAGARSSMPGVARGTMFVMPYPHSGSRPSSSIRDRLRHQTRVEEQLPEAIREAGKMVSRQRRADSWIDPDEEDLDAGLDAVLQGLVRGAGARVLGAGSWCSVRGPSVPRPSRCNLSSCAGSSKKNPPTTASTSS